MFQEVMSGRSDLRLEDLSEEEIRKILNGRTSTKNIDDFKVQAYNLYKIAECFEEKKKKVEQVVKIPKLDIKGIKQIDATESDALVRKIHSEKGKSIYYYYMKKYEQIKIDKAVSS